ncbi:hypothetical protein B0H14DRAFT_3493972 [Mycena olivaceomarginata]|nr:hypothetical protein B0H14DRAFT_3493972 [Mycena olivaceomarginata]
MTRKKTGKSRGRKSDFMGEKAEWLDTFRDQLRDAGKDPGSVYTDATNAFITRYRYDLPFAENVDRDPESKPPVILPTTDEEEKARRGSIQQKLRIKLSNYFRNRWRAKKVHSAAIAGILGTMQTMSGPGSRPQCKPNLAVYLKLHYASRVKPQFDLVWADAKKTVPWTERVAMSQDYARTCWEKESPQFRAEVEEAGIAMHQADMEEWKASRKSPEGSAEEYHNAMESLNEVGIPLADALAERLGSHVVILIVGPVGSEKGEGFTAMENSITCYGHAAFSKAECRGRAWLPLEDGTLSLPDGLLSMDQATPPITTPAVVATPVSHITPVPANTAPTPTPVPVPVPVPSIITPTITPTVPVQQIAEDGIDRVGWSESLIETHAYLTTKNWGPRWTALLSALVDSRVIVVPYYHIGSDFGDQLFDWWKDLGAADRWTGVGGEGEKSEASRVQSDFFIHDWIKLHGIGADDAALAANKLWQLMVEDITWVLKDVLTQDHAAVEEWQAEKAIEQREMEDNMEEMGDAVEKEGEDATDKTKKTLPKPAKKPTKAAKGQPVTASKKRKCGEDGNVPAAKKQM